MIEKVSPSHPDKIADRIAGAIVDLAYKKAKEPKVAVEVLVGHGGCNVIIETSEVFKHHEVVNIVKRVAGNLSVNLTTVEQDGKLSENQRDKHRCGDNGIFRGVPLTEEEKTISKIAKDIYKNYPTDGKYILSNNDLIICQSNADTNELSVLYPNAKINPLGEWYGGTNVDTGATNRKLGSDMGHSVTGGGLHGKDLTKADVAVNIYAFLMAQTTGEIVELYCAIGDETVGGIPYCDIERVACAYIKKMGGFEKFAEWGLF